MTTTEQFERLYRDASPAMKQRLDDIVTGASICQERKDGHIHRDHQGDPPVSGDRAQLKGDPK